jgi:hypothetical protein
MNIFYISVFVFVYMFMVIMFTMLLDEDIFPLKKPWRGIAFLLWPITTIVTFLYIFIVLLKKNLV